MMVRKLLLMILLASASLASIGCKDSLLDRSLIFSTHTTLGVEVSASPAESGEPVKLIIGYKRSEGVINPVYHSDGIETADEEQSTARNEPNDVVKTIISKGRRPRYRDQAYSVIAKFRGDAGTSATGAAEGKVSVAQWFATGEAAMTLASQPGIAGAVTGSSEVAREATRQAELGQSLSRNERTAVFAFLSDVHSMLDKREQSGDRRAGELVADLDKVGEQIDIVLDFTNYRLSDNNTMTSKDMDVLPGPPTGFQRVLSYQAALNQSKKALSTIINSVSQGAECKLNDEVITSEMVEPLKKRQAEQQQRLEEFENRIGRDSSVLAAVDYFCELLRK